MVLTFFIINVFCNEDVTNDVRLDSGFYIHSLFLPEEDTVRIKTCSLCCWSCNSEVVSVWYLDGLSLCVDIFDILKSKFLFIFYFLN
jgi:hypothetical protein